jgi:adenine-specific DNA-methyltransferase
MAKQSTPVQVETLKHEDATRKNIPTAEYQSVMQKEKASPIQVAYERRNKDLDPQLVWRGKDVQDWSDLVVNAPPLYIQEKVHPKVLIDDLMRQTHEAKPQESNALFDLSELFNGVPEGCKTEFYQYDARWTNRMILGDSLQVMASLAEREGLRGKVQCIYLDPPYGIKFNSNFQWSTTSRDVKDGHQAHITREPEQVKAFRDTWRDGIHSYLTYLRDRLTVARDLLTESGSIFVQIGDENVHRVRAAMDEIFGEENFVCQIPFSKTSGATSNLLASVADYLLWYAKAKTKTKFRKAVVEANPIPNPDERYVCVETPLGEVIDLSVAQKSGKLPLPEGRILRLRPTDSQDETEDSKRPVSYNSKNYYPPKGRHWSVTSEKMKRVVKSGYVYGVGNTLTWKFYRKPNFIEITNDWMDIKISGFGSAKTYVVETTPSVIQKCILMTTDPGDLVLDPTCGSGTTAFVAEHWGRRWITVDTSRVALALARARIMGARYPYYYLADSIDGQLKEAEISNAPLSSKATRGDIRHGFVYERMRRVTLSIIADNLEIDVIWEKYQETLEPLRTQLNKALSKKWEEWEIPREAEANWSAEAKQLHAQWWQQRIARQKEIDASIAAKAEFEYLYDKPYEDKKKIRVAGPFTVESITPHRVLGVDENDNFFDGVSETKDGYGTVKDFTQMILENLHMAGVQQAHKDDKITFTALTPWPGTLICAEGRYREGGEGSPEKRAAIFIGPEFGTVSRPDLVSAAREAGDADFDVLITCAFNYDAHSADFAKLGRIPVLKARMNADLHMADDLRNSGKGNLFVIFGEPDIDILEAGNDQIQVKINGVDVFHPNTGEVRSDSADGIACWFIDTDYNEESFFVRHAYFLGQNDPYNALRTTLKAEINQEAWESLHSDTSRSFDKPKSGRIAVKVINHLGDEVMKVFKVDRSER